VRGRLVLASASPRRADLLRQLDVPFEVVPSEIPETLPPGPVKEAVTALALAKQAVYASESHSLSQMLDLELEHQLRCFASRDAREGFTAFLEKRQPSFQGT